MRISVFGLGYVGVVATGCLAHDGHEVIGVDPNPEKVRLINEGKSPIVEAEIGELIVAAGSRIRATDDTIAAVRDTELSLVCVGTPSQGNGSLDLSYVRRVCEQIGLAIRDKDERHTVVIRSTILPGTMATLVRPVLEETSGKLAGSGFGLCNNPEFLREGTAVHDYRNPPKTVIGEVDVTSGDIVASLYAGLDAPLIRTSLEVAETVKYVDNVWHAVKVAFANEVGSICKQVRVDGHQVMNIFCQDTKLNISPYYMKPGFAFGGSCLPKDVRALSYKAQTLDLDLPLLRAIMPSNRSHIDRGFDMIIQGKGRKIGILGFSFKAGTDDLRESPLVEIIERLIGKGYDVRVYDRNVSLAALQGGNRDYILNHIPHISRLMVDSIDSLLDHAQIVVIGNGSPEFKNLTVREGQHVVDLVRVGNVPPTGGSYDGICW
ncbi:nucleotide sugar dehydrogenase [Bordetella sp. FB-8]|uniref:nucleotide sugar dehydrogenase n=1 Tax=Bordetella sp. FB-8 TaxID=1159870 RepID=UPI0004766C1F|nr:nucleotide sugar dehydrogenase [Bordetella sp. FB-8]